MLYGMEGIFAYGGKEKTREFQGFTGHRESVRLDRGVLFPVPGIHANSDWAVIDERYFHISSEFAAGYPAFQ